MQQALLHQSGRFSCPLRTHHTRQNKCDVSAAALPQISTEVLSDVRHKAMTKMVGALAAASVLLSGAGSSALAADILLTADPVVSRALLCSGTGHHQL